MTKVSTDTLKYTFAARGLEANTYHCLWYKIGNDLKYVGSGFAGKSGNLRMTGTWTNPTSDLASTPKPQFVLVDYGLKTQMTPTASPTNPAINEQVTLKATVMAYDLWTKDFAFPVSGKGLIIQNSQSIGGKASDLRPTTDSTGSYTLTEACSSNIACHFTAHL